MEHQFPTPHVPEQLELPLDDGASALGRPDCGGHKSPIATPSSTPAESSPSPAHGRAIYRRVRAHRGHSVTGNVETLEAIALLASLHLVRASGPPRRAVIVGPSGSAKSTLLHALTGLGLPCAIVDLTELAETNWMGLNLADVLTNLRQQAERLGVPVERSILLLDEMDKIAAASSGGSGRDYQFGRQRSLLPLLGGGTLHYGLADRDRSQVVSTAGMMVVGAGVFEGVPRSGRLGPRHLIRLGLMQELVERRGVILRMEQLRGGQLADVIHRQAMRAALGLEALGIEVDILPEACGYLARAIDAGAMRVGTRQAVAVIERVVQRKVRRMLGGDPVERIVIAPDDIAGALSGI